MRIAIIGTREIPAHHGGFETCVEETATRLLTRGHQVTVFAGADEGQRGWRVHEGVQIVYTPGLPTKHLFTVSQSGLSAVRAALGEFDVAHLYNLGNACWLPVLKLARVPTVISVDGLDWRRERWGTLTRRYVLLCARLAVRLADELIMDSRAVSDYYERHYGRAGAYVPYGAHVASPAASGALSKHGLSPKGYLLFVGRLTPEKGVHRLVEAFGRVRTQLRLAIVGDDPFGRDYVAQLKATADPRVRFLGYVYGDECAQLLAHAYAYATASEVEGTSPALLTAMGQGCCPVVNGIAENRETIGDAGIAYAENDTDALAAALQRLVDDPSRAKRLGHAARERVRTVYNWDRVTDALEAVYAGVASPQGNQTHHTGH